MHLWNLPRLLGSDYSAAGNRRGGFRGEKTPGHFQLPFRGPDWRADTGLRGNGGEPLRSLYLTQGTQQLADFLMYVPSLGDDQDPCVIEFSD